MEASRERRREEEGKRRKEGKRKREREREREKKKWGEENDINSGFEPEFISFSKF